MSYIRLDNFPRGTREQYLAVDAALGDEVDDAPGRLLFAAGGTPDGWQIVQLWESRDQLEDWVRKNLGAAFAKVGDRGYPAPPQITDFEVQDLRITVANGAGQVG